MEISDAQLILAALVRDLPQANGQLVGLENHLRSVRDGAGQIVAGQIMTRSMRDLQGLVSSTLEDTDRIRAKLTAMHRIMARQLPGGG